MSAKKKGLAIYLLPLGIFCIIWWCLPLGTKTGIQEVFTGIQAPIYAAVEDTTTLITKLKKQLISKDVLIAEYEKLARMNMYLQVRINDLLSASQDNSGTKKSILEELDTRFKFIYANVVRRDLASWSDELVINKGARAGIKIGDGVIAGRNVVGRIKKIYQQLSVVELLSSPHFRTSACLENDNFPVIFHGCSGSGIVQYRGLAENMITDLPTRSTEHKIIKPEKIKLVSSYLSGVFPGGLTIGYLENISDLRGGMFLKAAVEIDGTFINTLHEVVVVSQKQVE